jgi:DNA polymerase-3 subunit epsilon
LTDLGDPFHSYNEPKKKITQEITDLTGITADKVSGQKIPLAELTELVAWQDLVIAHHAQFDRPMLERVCPGFAKKCWGCTMEQIPWKKHGHESNRLGSILTKLGLFYEAHNAMADCYAGLYALTSMVGDKTALAHVLEASRATTAHVWALKAPYDAKDLLKARGYFWNGGEDGRPKAWHKEIPFASQDEERSWLGQNVYNNLHCPARFDQVTAFNRFTKRG